MQNWSQSYQKIDALPAESGGAEVWLSPAPGDSWWDDFLRSTPCGQYQQSSLWAEYKAGEGWNHHRMILTGTAGIVGGVQILWKKTRVGRIGYVSKGPVAQPEESAVIRQLFRLLRSAAKELRLSALIVQQPDESQISLHSPKESGFIQSNPLDVIEATYLVDVGDGMKAVRSRMHPKARQYVRKAQQAGLVVRSGTEADLPLFFNLMSATCRRQNSAPNPANLDSLCRLWRLFAASGSTEMAFAQRDGVDIAGRLNLIFGSRVTQWKKGWDGSHPNCHPNELLADHALEWAQARGHRICDFSGINRLTAVRLLAGQAVDASVARSRDMFNLRLGGFPRLLPRAQLFLVNPILSWSYRNSYNRLEQHKEHRLLASTNQPGNPPAK